MTSRAKYYKNIELNQDEEPVDGDVQLIDFEHKIQFGHKHLEFVFHFGVGEIVFCFVGVKLKMKS